MKRIFIIILLQLTFIGSSVGQESNNQKFDTEKWKSSSEYRWETVINTNDFPSFHNKTKSDIIDILGEPSYENERRLIYCLSIESTYTSKDEHENDLCCKCKGSYIIIDPNVESPFIVTVVNVDPLPSK